MIGVSFADEIQVTLFGQPCQMVAAHMSVAQLKIVNDLSPEKNRPMMSLERLKPALSALKKLPKAPPSLDVYRTQIEKRFAAELAFQEALLVVRKNGDRGEEFLDRLRPFVPLKKHAEFEALVRKLNQAKENESGWSSAATESMNDYYMGVIEAYPEEEFHRAIQKLGIRYACGFDAQEKSAE